MAVRCSRCGDLVPDNYDACSSCGNRMERRSNSLPDDAAKSSTDYFIRLHSDTDSSNNKRRNRYEPPASYEPEYSSYMRPPPSQSSQICECPVCRGPFILESPETASLVRCPWCGIESSIREISGTSAHPYNSEQPSHTASSPSSRSPPPPSHSPPPPSHFQPSHSKSYVPPDSSFNTQQPQSSNNSQSSESKSFSEKKGISLQKNAVYTQGYIRIDTMLENSQEFIITDVSIKFRYNNNALTFSHTEPKELISGNEIVFSILRPGEKKLFSVYFFPVGNGEATIDGLVSYNDARNNLCAETMDKTFVKLVLPRFIAGCPACGSVEELQQLASSSSFKDSKKYIFSHDSDVGLIFHDMVASLISAGLTEMPSDGSLENENLYESWFSGSKESGGEKIIVKAGVSPKTHEVEIRAHGEKKELVTSVLYLAGLRFKNIIEQHGHSAKDFEEIILSSDTELNEMGKKKINIKIKNKTEIRVCPLCNTETRFIEQYSRWYCNSCKKYI